MSIVFLVVRAKKRRSDLGWQAFVVTYTKCLIVVPIPPFWIPFTNEAAIMPDKKGSSEKLSKLYIGE